MSTTDTKTKTVSLFINGTDVGTRNYIYNKKNEKVSITDSTTVAEFVQSAAKEHGIRSFCVMSGKRKVRKEESDHSVTEFERIDVNAKDSRGSNTYTASTVLNR